ncbi:glycine cleavage system aminomethyltransferase GcvT [Sagittula salina]|uniref:aminomethyltransferase n=1 Tax=Sagittula salina TaxID=2820268 RepID=A0A940MK41_9RHOB|nr:glycine cleavage system aminomethyltransferase GcvT [Sagittula salina]MBP0483265.1 glycine cleavage system aminomethyltransferase GcvT [Sagittula salina]
MAQATTHDTHHGELQDTCLNGLHRELGARMVPFAGYEMPVQYPLGVLKEHLHTRAAAGLFDVSHMGQVILRGAGLDAALERIVPVDVAGLPVGRQKYGYFTNDNGGIEDDLMIARRDDHLFVVVNAARKGNDLALLRRGLEPEGITVELIEGRALIALQGPQAEDVLAALAPAVRDMRFMDVATVDLQGAEAWVSRSGYTGEDGFEISIPESDAEALCRALLTDERVEAIGLGARDSLRLEAGLCLYGNDIDSGTSPVEAGLTWAMGKRRKAEGGFTGAAEILKQLEQGVDRKRVGLKPEGRAPMRSGVALFDAEDGGEKVGEVTSGGFGPSVNGPVAMGYVSEALSTVGTRLWGEVRGKRMAVDVAALPFVPNGFKR